MKFTHSALAVSLAMCCQAAMAQEFSQTVFFGDSLTDTGRLTSLIKSDPLGKAFLGASLSNSFTTNPDTTWAGILAGSYGHSAIANDGTTLDGTNYAVGSAQSLEQVSLPLMAFKVPSVSNQVDGYLSMAKKADPNALYSVWIGANDLLTAANDPTTAPQKIITAAQGTVASVTKLQQAGANYILVPNLPDVGLTERYYKKSKQEQQQATQAAAYYNASLYNGLNATSANVIPLNTFTLLQEAVDNPEAFGFKYTNQKYACKKHSVSSLTSLACNETRLVEEGANQTYIFADEIHPSGKTHRLLAQYARSVIEAPSAIGQLPSAITRQGSRDYQALNHRLETLPTGKNSVWIEGGTSKIKSTHATTDADPSVMIGAGFGGERSHTGVYAKFGSENHRLSDTTSADVQSRGVGLYHRHDLDKFGINLQAGVDHLNTDTDRRIAWEGVDRMHSATAKGTRLHAGAQVGVTLGTDTLSYRPYLGVNVQEVTIKDLVEDHSDLSTAMRFHNQKQTSLQGEAGVNVVYQLADKHRLYGGIGYTHEFQDDARQIGASLTSISQYNRGFSLPVAASDHSGIHAHLGMMTKVNDQFAINATLSANHANRKEQDVSGAIGIQAQF